MRRGGCELMSPGFRTWLSETVWAPVVVIQTSPDDLLTDQASPSPACAMEAAPRASAIARMRPNPPALIIEISLSLQLIRRLIGDVSTLNEGEIGQSQAPL
jgi:hypothetical protein